MSDVLTLAEGFFDAVSGGDIERVGAYYADDAVIWHNYDGIEQPKAANLVQLGSIAERYEGFGYIDARCVEVEGGFLRQHTIQARRNGKTALVPAILRVYVEGDKIQRIEEYFDYGQLTSQLS